MLNVAEFGGRAIDERQAQQLIAQAEALFHQVDQLAVSS